MGVTRSRRESTCSETLLFDKAADWPESCTRADQVKEVDHGLTVKGSPPTQHSLIISGRARPMQRELEIGTLKWRPKTR
jgi:hypothetical protein